MTDDEFEKIYEMNLSDDFIELSFTFIRRDINDYCKKLAKYIVNDIKNRTLIHYDKYINYTNVLSSKHKPIIKFKWKDGIYSYYLLPYFNITKNIFTPFYGTRYCHTHINAIDETITNQNWIKAEKYLFKFTKMLLLQSIHGKLN